MYGGKLDIEFNVAQILGNLQNINGEQSWNLIYPLTLILSLTES